MLLGWCPFKIVSGCPNLLLPDIGIQLKIEISLNGIVLMNSGSDR
jgi:hypothetical protein